MVKGAKKKGVHYMTMDTPLAFLKEDCKKYGLPVSGTKAKLFDRLQKYYAKQAKDAIKQEKKVTIIKRKRTAAATAGAATKRRAIQATVKVEGTGDTCREGVEWQHYLSPSWSAFSDTAQAALDAALAAGDPEIGEEQQRYLDGGEENPEYLKKKSSERRIRLQKGVKMITAYGKEKEVGDGFKFYIITGTALKRFKAM
jgi:hypothetical protein